MRVAVVGAGSWGTAVADLCAVERRRRAVGARALRSPRASRPRTRTRLPAGHRAAATQSGRPPTSAQACSGRRRGRDGGSVARLPGGARAGRGPSIGADVPVISLSKGVEQGTRARMTQVVADVLPAHPVRAHRCAHRPEPRPRGRRGSADGVGRGGDRRRRPRTLLQHLFMTPTFRVYTNPDVVGCEIAGALKNVIALAVGAAAGLGFGDNTRAALDHARAGRARAPGRRARRRSADLLRPRGNGRSRRDVHQREEPQPDGRLRARAGAAARRDRRPR